MKYTVCGPGKKRRYNTQVAAALNAAHRSRKEGGLPLRVYRCPVCHGWHLTRSRTKGKP